MLSINGVTKIYRVENGGHVFYNIPITSKKPTGGYDKMYMTAALPKDTAVENNADIRITKAFLSFYRNGKGFATPKIQIIEFELINSDAGNIDIMPNDSVYIDDIMPF